MGKNILFVCTGNTCRSIMAEALARQRAESFAPDRGLNFISAGLSAWPGQPASDQAVETMREIGVDITPHRARQVSEELVQKADLILTMTGQHKKILLATFPGSADKVFTLVEFADRDDRTAGGPSGYGHGDISDPFGRPVEVYRRCAGEMRLLIEKALHKIIRQ